MALFAVGFGLVVANLKIFNLAHEAVFAWAAVITYFLTVRFGVPLLVAWAVAIVLSAALDVLVYFILVRHLEGRRDRELAAFVSTLGGLSILLELADIVLQRRTVRLLEDSFPAASWEFWGLRVSSNQVLMGAVALVAFVVLWYVVEKTRFGREVRAVAFDRETSNLLGVNARAVTVAVFGISGAMAALAAVPVAISYNAISSDLGAAYVLLAMAIMVLGGFGSVMGTLIGGLAVGVATSLTSAYISSSYRDLIVFVALIAVLVLRPNGLFVRTSEVKRA